MRYTLAILSAAAVVKAVPFPQAVTAAISPTGPSPPGCTGSMAGSFGIAAMNLTTASAALAKRAVSQLPRAQPEAPAYTLAPVSMIMDGQIQGGMHTMTMSPVSQIPDGQVQAPAMLTMAPVTVVSDSQSQAPVITATPVSQVSDGDPQASSAILVSRNTNAQQQVSTASSSAPSSSSSPGITLVSCRSESTLELTLNDGILKDAQGRTGYIASNFQFQFDAPPQAGAIYTSGFSVCGNGSLALGGSTIFYQCLSGNFYNLYDRYWAPQCSPVTIETLTLQDCS